MWTFNQIYLLIPGAILACSINAGDARLFQKSLSSERLDWSWGPCEVFMRSRIHTQSTGYLISSGFAGFQSYPSVGSKLKPTTYWSWHFYPPYRIMTNGMKTVHLRRHSLRYVIDVTGEIRRIWKRISSRHHNHLVTCNAFSLWREYDSSPKLHLRKPKNCSEISFWTVMVFQST